MKKTLKFHFWVTAAMMFIAVACSKDDPPAPSNPTGGKSASKEIISFSFDALSPAVAATVDPSAKTISATVPSATDLTKLVPTISLSAKASISPGSGVVQDFSKEVSYTVTAEDGSKQVYRVTISMVSNDFSTTIQKIISLDMIESAKNANIVIYGGEHPKAIEGTYKMADCIISASDESNLINRKIQPITYNFANYDDALKSVEQRLKQSNGDNGSTVSKLYVAGTGNYFSLFRTFTNTDTGKKYYETYSGILSPNGKKDFTTTIFYFVDNKAVVSTTLIDKDGFSESLPTFQ